MTRATEYPFLDQRDNHFKFSLGDRLLARWRTLKAALKPAREPADVRIWPLRPEGVRPLGAQDMPLVLIVKNDFRFMPSFFRHYRNLGVTRFLCLDDQSNDGTREFLLAQPDADVFGSNVDYTGASRSRRWREMLFELYGADRWYLNLDADEFLVFDRYETRTLRDLIGALERDGALRCPAPMIDAYPPGDVSAARFDGSTDDYPWTVATQIDGRGYRLGKNKHALTLMGGVRLRVFGVDCELMKYPLLYWKQGFSLGDTIHRPRPTRENFAPIRGVLLHFKIFDSFKADVRRIVEAGQHHRGSMYYKAIEERMESGEDIDLMAPHSMTIKGSESLRAAGFFAPLN